MATKITNFPKVFLRVDFHDILVCYRVLSIDYHDCYDCHDCFDFYEDPSLDFQIALIALIALISTESSALIVLSQGPQH